MISSLPKLSLPSKPQIWSRAGYKANKETSKYELKMFRLSLIFIICLFIHNNDHYYFLENPYLLIPITGEYWFLL